MDGMWETGRVMTRALVHGFARGVGREERVRMRRGHASDGIEGGCGSAAHSFGNCEGNGKCERSGEMRKGFHVAVAVPWLCALKGKLRDEFRGTSVG